MAEGQHRRAAEKQQVGSTKATAEQHKAAWGAIHSGIIGQHRGNMGAMYGGSMMAVHCGQHVDNAQGRHERMHGSSMGAMTAWGWHLGIV